MKGGTGDNDAQGVPSGGLIGLINVPVALRTLTETMLLLEDANPGKLAATWVGKVTKRTTVRSLRKRLRKEAYAARALESIREWDPVASAL